MTNKIEKIDDETLDVVETHEIRTTWKKEVLEDKKAEIDALLDYFKE